MRESQTVRCPVCGGCLDAYVFVKSIHMDSDLGQAGSIEIEWQPSLIEGHEHRFGFTQQDTGVLRGSGDGHPKASNGWGFDDAFETVDTPADIWREAGVGALSRRTMRKGRPIVDVQLPPFPTEKS